MHARLCGVSVDQGKRKGLNQHGVPHILTWGVKAAYDSLAGWLNWHMTVQLGFKPPWGILCDVTPAVEGASRS